MRLIEQIHTLLLSGLDVHADNEAITLRPESIKIVDDRTLLHADGCGEIRIAVDEVSFMTARRDSLAAKVAEAAK